VHPLTEPLRLLGLDAGVLRDPVAAGAGELIEPVLLDLALGVQAERFLDLDLDPEALAVEAVLIALLVSEQPVVPLPDVFQRPAPGVVDAHRVVRGDRPVEERPRLVPRVLLPEALERPFPGPALADAMLDRDMVGLLFDWFEGHGP